MWVPIPGMSNRVRLATRGSDLALRQAAGVKEALASRRHDVELVEVETTGDRLQDALITELGKTGAFVRNLDLMVLDGEVEGAVHSMKDMPTEMPDGLIVAAVPERAAPGDVLVTPDGRPLGDLPEGATVGTSSLRRKAQLLAERPDLHVEPIRGNVDTRVEKLLAPALQAEHEDRMEADKDRKGNVGKEGYVPKYEITAEQWFNGLAEIKRRALERDPDVEYDALVLARAGLERSGLDYHVEFAELPVERFVPAPGQGAIAVTSRDTDLAESVHRRLDHPRTRVETTVERTILAELNGGCIAPIGVHAVVQGEHVHVVAQVFSVDGTETVRAKRDLSIKHYLDDARDLAGSLRERGAADLIEAARER